MTTLKEKLEQILDSTEQTEAKKELAKKLYKRIIYKEIEEQINKK